LGWQGYRADLAMVAGLPAPTVGRALGGERKAGRADFKEKLGFGLRPNREGKTFPIFQVLYNLQFCLNSKQN
jgi:hypothetical protein